MSGRTGVDGNRTCQEPRERPFNGFEGRLGNNSNDVPATTYEDLEKSLPHFLPTQLFEDPEFALIASNWPRLPGPIKAGIVAMVIATTQHCLPDDSGPNHQTQEGATNAE